MNTTFEKRVMAFSIDTSAIFLILLVLSNLGGLIGNFVAGGLCIAFLIFGYFVPYIFLPGQTYGKKFQKIRIVKANGENASLARIEAREIFKVILSITTFGIYIFISGLFVIIKGGDRTIHDYIFGTKIVDADMKYDFKVNKGKDNQRIIDVELENNENNEEENK